MTIHRPCRFPLRFTPGTIWGRRAPDSIIGFRASRSAVEDRYVGGSCLYSCVVPILASAANLPEIDESAPDPLRKLADRKCLSFQFGTTRNSPGEIALEFRENGLLKALSVRLEMPKWRGSAWLSRTFSIDINNLQTVWRRGWDSNPRYRCRHAAFRVRCFRPLSHLSAEEPATIGAKAATAAIC